MRLIDADDLKEALFLACDTCHSCPHNNFEDIIDNAPTVAVDNYSMGYQDGVRKVLSERPKGER